MAALDLGDDSLSLRALSRTLGIVGGGQLGRMLVLAASQLGIECVVLDPDAGCPAAQVASAHVPGAITDAHALRELALRVDVLTVEIEHVNVDALEAAAAAAGVPVHPAPSTLRLIQDKLRQKTAMRERGVPLGDFCGVESEADLAVKAQAYGFPCMAKARRCGYDGRGNFTLKSVEDVPTAWVALGRGGGGSGGIFLERWVPFVRELAVVIARTPSGACAAYPPVHTLQRDSICHVVIAPAAGVAPSVLARARAVAAAAVADLGGAGVFGVELFELPSGDVFLNEIAPRVHNSGHFTIEGSVCSQFEQHVRAVCGLPLGDPSMRVPAALMINVLGTGDGGEHGERTWRLCAAALALSPGAGSGAGSGGNGSGTGGSGVHWYRKGGSMRKGRKVGHITLTGESYTAVLARTRALLAIAGESGVGAAEALTAAGCGEGGAGGAPPPPQPLVAIIMGSDSDLPTMVPAAELLRAFGVPFELTVVSAHRTPSRMAEYSRGARSRGLRVIIAAAGGAAHLPGMVAAQTPLPVIGVPVPLRHLDGVDSLHSIVQMPRGVPVATVGIGNATNAALLAVRILGAGGDGGGSLLLDALEAHARASEAEVLGKAQQLEALGWEAYLAKK